MGDAPRRSARKRMAWSVRSSVRWYPSSGGRGGSTGSVVAHELGVVLVGLAVEEPVVAVEPAPERPLVARAAGRHLAGRGEVPLADRERRIALVAQDLRQEAVLLRDRRVVAGESRGQLDDAGHAVGVMVAPGEQARPGGRAEGGRVEVRVAPAVGGQSIERRSLDVGSVAPELGVTHVVEQHHHDVGGVVGSSRQRWPPRHGFVERRADRAVERLAHGAQPRQDGEILDQSGHIYEVLGVDDLVSDDLARAGGGPVRSQAMALATLSPGP